MKFAHYLEDTRIPEWKKNYIDFKGLKKQIAVIRHERNDKHAAHDPSTSSSPHLATAPSDDLHASVPPRRSSTASQGPIPTASNDPGHAPSRHLVPPLGSGRSRLNSSRRAVKRFPRSDVPAHATLREFLDTLTPLERDFFDKLDHEADKIEKFYVSREGMAQEQLESLKGDLKELNEHHHLHKRAPQENKWLSFISDAVPGSSHGQQVQQPADAPEPSDKDQEQAINDPEDYATARKKLKKDFLEFYRGLELLNDYRVLNETGFHKALKKFDKVTKSISRRLYIREKIEPLRFSNKEEVLGMLNEVEELYADSFEKGSLRRARDRLHSTPPATTHHSSTFRSGILLGLALPAIVIGIRQALRPSVRARVPEWNPLLQVYAMLFIPTAFSLLITLNVLVWAHARINYVFIFALDRRSALDSRQYAQIPAFLMFLLAYAFMFSFTSIWSPTAWPLLWTLFTVVFLFNPLPILTHRARWWFVRILGRQLRSGTHRVKYADFWIADQLCSLAFPLGNLYLVGCIATTTGGWERAIPRCELTKNPHWPAVFVLAVLGPIIRLIQCIRRWSDEGRSMHLVNAGKYTSMIVMYLCYYVWRYHGGLPGRHKVIYIVFAAVSAVYTSYWDIVRDWSVVSAWPPRWLVREVAFEFHRWLYPIATALNVLLRFFWVFYLPVRGPSPPLRTFIVASVEALRRIMWNFFRVENDHVGNTDQFHATKEVPLPYQFQDLGNDDDDAEYRESRFGRAEGQRAVDNPGRFAAVGAVEEKQATSDGARQ